MAGSAMFMGIPRRNIPWFPTIDPDLCSGCGECTDVCPNDVFAPNDTAGKTAVANPYNCVVLCDKCVSFCQSGALSFPDKEETKDLIARLRATVRMSP